MSRPRASITAQQAPVTSRQRAGSASPQIALRKAQSAMVTTSQTRAEPARTVTIPSNQVENSRFLSQARPVSVGGGASGLSITAMSAPPLDREARVDPVHRAADRVVDEKKPSHQQQQKLDRLAGPGDRASAAADGRISSHQLHDQRHDELDQRAP